MYIQKQESRRVTATLFFFLIYAFLVYVWCFSSDANKINRIYNVLSTDEIVMSELTYRGVYGTAGTVPLSVNEAMQKSEDSYKKLLDLYATELAADNFKFPSFAEEDVKTPLLRNYLHTINERSEILSHAKESGSLDNEHNLQRMALFVRAAGSEAAHYLIDIKILFFMTMLTPLTEMLICLKFADMSDIRNPQRMNMDDVEALLLKYNKEAV